MTGTSTTSGPPSTRTSSAARAVRAEASLASWRAGGEAPRFGERRGVSPTWFRPPARSTTGSSVTNSMRSSGVWVSMPGCAANSGRFARSRTTTTSSTAHTIWRTTDAAIARRSVVPVARMEHPRDRLIPTSSHQRKASFAVRRLRLCGTKFESYPRRIAHRSQRSLHVSSDVPPDRRGRSAGRRRDRVPTTRMAQSPSPSRNLTVETAPAPRPKDRAVEDGGLLELDVQRAGHRPGYTRTTCRAALCRCAAGLAVSTAGPAQPVFITTYSSGSRVAGAAGCHHAADY